METSPDTFLDVNLQMNDAINALLGTLRNGTPPAPAIERLRAQATAGLQRLQGMSGRGDPNVAKVAHHLDLFIATLESVDSAPVLARKLLTHLLEEQLEITAQASTRASVATAAPMQPMPAAKPPADELGGGRKPLTVGSLIGR